ncbi:isopentenyl-diphosphate Delta-isomerase [Alloactinosynnema sp. L-07]|uniref:isopentenyl-diphosphate Delta-isomerase n=1 Tax=Alloactinosynnema sp. L-07 TaxID=1653480 RepID=UPI0006B479C8|nr:isopentenyl-diphosphate Delta-isomerase [Alloactinosynnema sp. L-07]
MTEEQVLLVDDAGHGIGTAAKADVHTDATPLHLAFSSYVFDTEGRFLVTRRALTKKTWPGVWTNSCCGHPAPGEPVEDAVRRRLAAELGLVAAELTLVLPEFRYRAVMPDGIVENELCPVFRVRADVAPEPNPAEVDSVEWVEWGPFVADVLAGRREISPWAVLQFEELDKLGPDPLTWQAGDPARLPAAIR